MTPRDVIIHAIHCDHRVGENADRIIKALEDNGYAIVRNATLRNASSTVDLPATLSAYDKRSTHMFAGAQRFTRHDKP